MDAQIASKLIKFLYAIPLLNARVSYTIFMKYQSNSPIYKT